MGFFWDVDRFRIGDPIKQFLWQCSNSVKCTQQEWANIGENNINIHRLFRTSPYRNRLGVVEFELVGRDRLLLARVEIGLCRTFRRTKEDAILA